MPLVLIQEIETWYVIPALRKELAKIFKQKGLTQKDTAKILGTTEATISHYFHDKRAKDVTFTDEEIKLIDEKATLILEDKNTIKHMYDICNQLRGSKTVCTLHKKYEKGLPANCDICKECEV